MLVGSGWRCGQCRPGRLAASVWDSVVWCGISVGFSGLVRHQCGIRWFGAAPVGFGGLVRHQCGIRWLGPTQPFGPDPLNHTSRAV